MGMARTPRWEPAYCEFFAARQRSFMRTAYAMLGSWTAAEDATQQTFTALYAKWPGISPDRIEAYARRVLVNTCIGIYRQRSREILRGEVPERGVREEHDERLALLAALTQLTARDRAVLALRFLDDLPVAEVAAILDVPEGTVKSQTSRALGRLQSVLYLSRKEMTS
jgi:RNA polymerase sigma-70 factor (sigma-E family)